ncbi:unnamed protein product [Brassica rapa subsp. narinosa]
MSTILATFRETIDPFRLARDTILGDIVCTQFFLRTCLYKILKINLHCKFVILFYTLSHLSLATVSQLGNTEEYIDGQLTGNLGEILIRCNNVLYVRGVPEDEELGGR